MNLKPNTKIITALAAAIEIPDEAYRTATARYEDLGKWLSEKTAHCHNFAPKISCQGSFRLGLVTRPINEEEEYDLDLACQLTAGFDKSQHSQKELKRLIGTDLEAYRQARRIEQATEEKNRCWRLSYKDQLKFHMDVVPCLLATGGRRSELRELMEHFGLNEAVARSAANLTVDITDRTAENYAAISPDWLVSNPDGYALWFVSRMKLAQPLLENFARQSQVASIDEIPVYRWKSPLQHAIQLLKRHRDVMFEDNLAAKPISIILTTLAARAYQGEADLAATIERILTQMEVLVNPDRPRVPNPMNPEEDFADKWHKPECRALQLEQNFRHWVKQARADFLKIGTSEDARWVAEQAQQRFRIKLDEQTIRSQLGLSIASTVAIPKATRITTPPPPWAG